MRFVTVPEPPGGFSGMPKFFEGAIRRAVVIGNGCAGAESQCIGLIRALGLATRYSLYVACYQPRGGMNKWLHWLPISLHEKLISIMRLSEFRKEVSRVLPLSAEKSGLLNVLEADAKQIAKMAHDTFENEGPLLVVASGRDKISVASSIKQLAPDNVFVVQIQHPRTHLERFDLVITPRHDYFSLTPEGQKQIPWFLRRWITPCEPPNKNVVLTVGALHQADSTSLRTAASAWHHELALLEKPLLVVNIGGPTRNCHYGVHLAKQLSAMLQNVLWSCGSIRISFSRRTPKKVSKIIMEELGKNPKVYIWDGEGLNPHMGHLAWADAFVVTADSVSMLSEVCTTGKPVFVIGAEYCKWKFADFQRTLHDRGAVRTFTGKENISETWSYPPLNDVMEAAARVNQAAAERGWRIMV